MSIRNDLDRLSRFTPTGDEGADLAVLEQLLATTSANLRDARVRAALVAIFERYPEADLGSPGPIVHCLEEAPIDDHIELLCNSIRRSPTIMTLWMVQRCLASNLTAENIAKITDVIRNVPDTGDAEITEGVAEILRDIT